MVLERGAFQDAKFVAASKKIVMVKADRNAESDWQQFGVHSAPTIILCDSDGKKIKDVPAADDAGTLIQVIEEAIGAPAGTPPDQKPGEAGAESK